MSRSLFCDCFIAICIFRSSHFLLAGANVAKRNHFIQTPDYNDSALGQINRLLDAGRALYCAALHVQFPTGATCVHGRVS